MDDDAVYLTRFARDHDQAAFAELVRRHLALVHNTALRRLGGDAHQARAAALAVFADLARKAAGLTHEPPILAGWLYRAAVHETARFLRAEQRRRRRETLYAAENSDAGGGVTPASSEAGLAVDAERLRPVLDDALSRLGERDRLAVLLRYFDGKAYAEVGGALGLSAEAARRRVERAMEKLRRALERRGVRSSAAAFAAALAAEAGVAPPAGLIASVSAGALAQAAGASAVATIAVGGTGWWGGKSVAVWALTLGSLGAAAVAVGVWGFDGGAAPAKVSAAIGDPADVGPASRRVEAADLLGADFLARLSAVAAEDYGRLLEELWRMGTPEARARFREVFTHWTGVDPASAARWSAITRKGEIGAPDGAELRRLAALAWAEADFAEALAWAKQEPDATRWDGLLAKILGHLAEADPAAALELAVLSDASEGRRITEHIAALWASREPQAAWAATGALEAREFRFLRARVAAAWARREPTLATAGFLTAIDDEEARATYYGTFEAAGDAATGLAVFLATVSWWETQGGGEVEPHFPAWPMAFLMSSLCRTHPDEASRAIRELPEGRMRDEILGAVAGTAEYRTNEGSRRTIRPELMLDLLDLMQDEEIRAGCRGIVLDRWATAEPAEALAWARGTQDARGADTVRSGALQAIAREDPTVAITAWREMGGDAASKEGAAARVAVGWAERDPSAAVAWFASEFPEPSNRGVMQAMLTEWMKKDSASATAWAERNGRRQVIGAAAMATQALFEDLPAGLALAARLAPDPETKLSAMRGRVAWWLKKDPAAATRFIEETTILTAEEKADLLASDLRGW